MLITLKNHCYFTKTLMRTHTFGVKNHKSNVFLKYFIGLAYSSLNLSTRSSLDSCTTYEREKLIKSQSTNLSFTRSNVCTGRIDEAEMVYQNEYTAMMCTYVRTNMQQFVFES